MGDPTAPLRHVGTGRRTLVILTRTTMTVLAIAVVVNAVSTIATDRGPLSWLAISCSVVGALTVLHRPTVGLVLTALAAPLALAAGAVTTGFWSSACFVAFVLTLRGTSGWVCGAMIAASNAFAAALEAGTIDVSVDASGSIAAFAAVVAATLGSAARANLDYRRAVEAYLRTVEAVRADAVDHGITQERLRIARDLHDSIGHHVAVANMRLGAAEMQLLEESGPVLEEIAGAREALASVLQETQATLHLLRRDGEPLTVTPGHLAVPELVARFAAGGLPLSSRVEGLDAPVTPRSSAAIYRMVQEGLTNAQKYGTGQVTVTVERIDDEVRVQVANVRAPGAATDAVGGHGLIGLRERAESVGGRLEVRSDDTLFWITADIPLTERTA